MGIKNIEDMFNDIEYYIRAIMKRGMSLADIAYRIHDIITKIGKENA